MRALTFCTVLFLAFYILACSSDQTSSEMTAPNTETEPQVNDRSASPGVEPVQAAQKGTEKVLGVEVCRALIPALTAGHINALDLDLYATSSVLSALREDTVFRGQESEMDVWSDDRGTCSMSGGGDAWYVLTLSSRPDGFGQYATAVRTEVSAVAPVLVNTTTLEAEQVCKRLIPLLTAGRINAFREDLETLATPEVIDKLRENTIFRDHPSPEVSTRVERGSTGTCRMSAGGDSWYELELSRRYNGG